MSELIIEAGRAESQYWRDIWRYRELFYVLAWRDIAVRYKQTAAGILWAVIQPLVNTILLTFVFNKVAGMQSSGNVPYTLVVFTGMMSWQFFTASLTGSSSSVLNNGNLISKVYFPRLIIPAGAVVTAFADMMISLFLLAGMLIFFHFWPTWRLLTLPAFIALGFGAALGPGLFLTALTVKFRDFRFIIPFLLQIGTYISPVGYASSKVGNWPPFASLHKSFPGLHLPFFIQEYFPGLHLSELSLSLRPLYSLNPMVGVIDGFRWSVLGQAFPLDLPAFAISVSMNIFLIMLGVWYFRKTERSFADDL